MDDYLINECPAEVSELLLASINVGVSCVRCAQFVMDPMAEEYRLDFDCISTASKYEYEESDWSGLAIKFYEKMSQTQQFQAPIVSIKKTKAGILGFEFWSDLGLYLGRRSRFNCSSWQPLG